jgi:quercetin dioxygenase-like cupin family protein
MMRAHTTGSGGEMDTWDIASLDVEPSQPRVLHSEPEGRAIAINLPAGKQMQEHQTHEHAYYVVASGEIEVENKGETITGGPGFLAHFEPHERRELSAKADTRLVLILTPYPAPGRKS